MGYSDSIADLSTNSFIAIPTSDVSLNDSSGIRLNTGYNQSGGIRGFSKQHTEGSTYHITIKYEGPDVSSNRPRGQTGYLPDFGEISMADASNNIFDPSCNPSPPDNKPTVIVNHAYPNVVYAAIQQPAYNGGAVEFYDISNINLIANSYNKQFNYHQTNISSTKVSYEEGKLRIEFPVDLSGNDLSLNYTNIDGIRDQNGGILQSFTGLDICSNVLWRDVSGGDSNIGTDPGFEAGYPFIHGDAGNAIYCRWDPNFTDFEGTPPNSYYLTEGTNKISCISQSSEQRPDGENVLKLIFDTSTVHDNSLYGNDPSYNILMYTKPVGKAGLRLGPQKFWVRDFSNNVLDNLGQPTMTITATNPDGVTVNSGTTTADPSLNLTFTSSITTSDFSSEDISSNGTISNFSGSGITYTATFTPDVSACIIEVEAGAYTTPFEKGGRTNIAATPFNWTNGDGTAPTISSSAWETQVYSGSSWSNKTTSNGQGSDADIIYTKERFIFYIQASETLDSSTPIVDISLNFKETTSGSYSTNTYTTASPGLSVGTTFPAVGSYTHNIIYEIPTNTHGDDNHGYPKFQFKLKDQAGNFSTLQSVEAQTGEATADVEVKEYTESDLDIPDDNTFYMGTDVGYIDNVSYGEIKNYMLNLDISGESGLTSKLLPSYSGEDKILSWTFQTTDSTLATASGRAYFKRAPWSGSSTSGGWRSGTNGYAHTKAGHVPGTPGYFS